MNLKVLISLYFFPLHLFSCRVKILLANQAETTIQTSQHPSKYNLE